MREILFRGKRTNNNKWYEGSLHIEYGETDKNGNRTLDYRILGMRGECDYVDPSTVGQYTGLTDKNGKMIFEGDICRNTSTGEIVSVKWHGTMAGFVWHKRQEKSHFFNFGELFRAHDKYEVIGNIHDTPEKE